MGTRWGINRNVAQVHALLFLSSRPMAAEEIARTLSVARSNVSTSLRELQGWRIVRGVSVFGDRRQHFESMKDLYEMFRVILEERKRREFDPTIAVVKECVAEAKKSGAGEPMPGNDMEELLGFVVLMSASTVRGVQKSFAERRERDVETPWRDPQNPARVTGAGFT